MFVTFRVRIPVSVRTTARTGAAAGSARHRWCAYRSLDVLHRGARRAVHRRCGARTGAPHSSLAARGVAREVAHGPPPVRPATGGTSANGNGIAESLSESSGGIGSTMRASALDGSVPRTVCPLGSGAGPPGHLPAAGSVTSSASLRAAPTVLLRTAHPAVTGPGRHGWRPWPGQRPAAGRAAAGCPGRRPRSSAPGRRWRGYGPRPRG